MKPGLRKRTSLTRRRSRGQSLVLIALILAVLIGLVALSVDVGNTYAQQRAAQRASDAASTDGMTALLSGQGCDPVRNKIRDSLKAHGIPNLKELTDPSVTLASGERGYQVLFIKSDKDSTPVAATACNADVLASTRYIKVQLTGTEQTNFATLFGRNDLPVNANAFAQRTICPPEPIGLRKDAFDTWPKEGDTTDTNYRDNDYRSGRPQRRFFLHTDLINEALGKSESSNTPGQFAWLRWTDDTSARALELALQPPGTLDKGFQEVVPWGDESVFGKAPDPYPAQKGILNAYDLVHGASTMNLGAGYKQSGPNGLNGAGGNEPIATQLKWLIDNHVAFNLAEFDAYNNGIGNAAVYRVIGFKSYMLVGYGFVPENPSAPNADRGYGWFLDLVRLGDPLECAQSEAAPEYTDQKVTLAGTVNIAAVYGDNVSGRPPLDMVIVLDSSGSMNWTWGGRGSVSGSMNPDLNPYVDGKDIKCADALRVPVGCQSSEAYKDYTQRKIYQAKQTLKNFMDNFQWKDGDRAAIVTYNGGNNNGPMNNALGSLTKVYPLATGGLTTDIQGLAEEMLTQAGSNNPGGTDPAAPYTTQGASPGALGLQRARQVLGGSGGGGRQRAVVFITDGLLNVFLNGYRNPDESLPANYDRSDQNQYPTNQAIKQAQLIKQDTSDKKAKIYVIALGNKFNRAGLDRMASDKIPPYLVSANNEGDLKRQLQDIGNQIINGPCDPQLEPILPPDAGRTVRYTASGYVPETDKAGQGSGGKVTVKLGGAIVGVANIGADGSFRIPDLIPNTDYVLTFNRVEDEQPVFYVGKDTPEAQMRNYSTVLDNDSEELPVRTNEGGINTTQFIHPDGSPIVLGLTGEGVCPEK